MANAYLKDHARMLIEQAAPYAETGPGYDRGIAQCRIDTQTALDLNRPDTLLAWEMANLFLRLNVAQGIMDFFTLDDQCSVAESMEILSHEEAADALAAA